MILSMILGCIDFGNICVNVYAHMCVVHHCICSKLVVFLLIYGNDSTCMSCTDMIIISLWTLFGYEVMYRTDRLPGYSKDYMGKEKEPVWMVQPDGLV